MKNKASKADIVLVLGVVGIIGVFITIISDLILLGRSNDTFSFFKMGMGTESMAYVSQWRITFGSFLGVFVLPFQIAGLMSVYQGLKSSGKALPLVVVIINAHALIMGVAFHISYAFIGSGWKLHYKIGNGISSDLLNQFAFYWKLLIIIMVIEVLFSSLIYVFLILKGKTLYPKWMALLNPVCVLLFLFPLIYICPAPVGGFIAPTYMNLSTMVFFVFSTIIIYRKLQKQIFIKK